MDSELQEIYPKVAASRPLYRLCGMLGVSHEVQKIAIFIRFLKAVKFQRSNGILSQHYLNFQQTLCARNNTKHLRKISSLGIKEISASVIKTISINNFTNML